jgi:hypothetical protein
MTRNLWNQFSVLSKRAGQAAGAGPRQPDAHAGRETLLRFIGDHPDQAAAYLAHKDGFVRQAALRSVPLSEASPALAVQVLDRCNDWVPSLRPLALARLRQLVAVLPAPDLFPLVAALLGRATNWRRWGGDMGGLTSVLDQPAMRSAVKTYLLSADHGPVVRQARWAMRLGIVEDALADLAQRAQSGALRAIATECLLDGKVYWTEGREKIWVDKPMGVFRTRAKWHARDLAVGPCDRLALLQSGATDKSAAVRRVVAEHLCKTGPEKALSGVIAALLTDQTPSVASRMGYFRQKWLPKAD